MGSAHFVQHPNLTVSILDDDVAGVRLSPDYPRGNAKGAVVLESLTGVENWRDSDLAKAKERLNGGATVQWESLDGLFDAVEKELTALQAAAAGDDAKMK